MKKIIIASIILVLTVVFGVIFVFKKEAGSPTVLPTSTATPTATQPVVPTPFPSSPTGFRGPTGLIERGSCTLSGNIRFTSKNIFASDAKIVYKNIDTEARLIKWTISPSDDLSPGPNLFNALAVPNGEYLITVRLPENPKSQSYKLTARVTYGEYINGNVEMREAWCRGSIPVTLAF